MCIPVQNFDQSVYFNKSSRRSELPILLRISISQLKTLTKVDDKYQIKYSDIHYLTV